MTLRSRVARCLPGLALLTVVAACSGETVCPAIAYGSTLVVTTDASATVVCTEEGCSDDPEPRGGPSQTNVAGSRHTFALFFAPATVSVRLTGADGVVTESTYRPDWRRVGGSERCGGPTEAELDLR